MTDYPEDVMKLAEEALDNLLCNCTKSCGGYDGLRAASILDIARAIMKDRAPRSHMTDRRAPNDINDLAKKAADAVGVTPYSDMRPFVEQAVKYALRSCLIDKPEMESVEAFAWHTSDVYGWDYISRNEENIRSKADEVGGEVTPLFATPPATPSSASQGSADVTSERVERLINAIEGECDGPPSPVGESREVPVKVVEGDSLGDRADLRRVVERVLDLPSAGLASSCELAATILDALEPALCASPSPVESREARLPDDIIERLLAVGRVEWGTSLYQADEKHVEDFRDTLRITREHFATEADETAIHGVYLEGTGTVLAHTGNSPNSPQHARILVGAWNQLVDMALAAKEQQP